MRYFGTSILVHVLIVSFIWVGFSVSSKRPNNSFIYLGEMMDSIEDSTMTEASKVQGQGAGLDITNESSAAFFTPWLKMRQVDKPR